MRLHHVRESPCGERRQQQRDGDRGDDETPPDQFTNGEHRDVDHSCAPPAICKNRSSSVPDSGSIAKIRAPASVSACTRSGTFSRSIPETIKVPGSLRRLPNRERTGSSGLPLAEARTRTALCKPTISAIEPCATTVPRETIATRSHTCSTSVNRWEFKKTAVPAAFNERSTS